VCTILFGNVEAHKMKEPLAMIDAWNEGWERTIA
jgi:hypothetical protein